MGVPTAVKPLVVGNWKMNGADTGLHEARLVAEALGRTMFKADVMICPPATMIAAVSTAANGSKLRVGGQDCHANDGGAHTGDISAAMLVKAGASAVILGHSERRGDHGETSALVAAKVTAAQGRGLMAIVCVGETAGERAAGLTMAVVARQLEGSLPQDADPIHTVIAYEPVWAICTGLVPSAGDVAAVHAAIRTALVKRFGAVGQSTRILYGGSVKPANAAELMAVANVNGALVGGASLKASDFLAILAAYHA